jgi:hypothetical protein
MTQPDEAKTLAADILRGMMASYAGQGFTPTGLTTDTPTRFESCQTAYLRMVTAESNGANMPGGMRVEIDLRVYPAPIQDPDEDGKTDPEQVAWGPYQS